MTRVADVSSLLKAETPTSQLTVSWASGTLCVREGGPNGRECTLPRAFPAPAWEPRLPVLSHWQECRG